MLIRVFEWKEKKLFIIYLLISSTNQYIKSEVKKERIFTIFVEEGKTIFFSILRIVFYYQRSESYPRFLQNLF